MPISDVPNRSGVAKFPCWFVARAQHEAQRNGRRQAVKERHDNPARERRRDFLRKLLKKQGYAPKRITTDKLISCAVAIREERLIAVHDQGLRANNRAKNSHRPVRRRE